MVLQERLKQQREEAKSNPGYRDEFKPKMSKEDQKGRRKQILSSIGAWLWSIGASQAQCPRGVVILKSMSKSASNGRTRHSKSRSELPCKAQHVCALRAGADPPHHTACLLNARHC